METTTKQVATIEHVECPFIEEYNSGKTLSFNGRPMRTAVWNLMLSKRDISIYARTNGRLIITRGWKVNDVKKYFGITGKGQALLDNFMKLYNQIPEIVDMNKVD